MKKFFYMAAICLPILFTGCEKRVINTTVTIYGTVVDYDTNEAINGAYVSLSPSSKDCDTDEDGTFQFSDVEYTSKGYTIRVKKEGYKDGSQNLYGLNPGESEKITLRLKKKE